MAYKMVPANSRMRGNTVSSKDTAPEVPPDDTAEDQEKPELLMVKDFVNQLDSTQFGYLQECIQKRLEGEMDEGEEKKSSELVFDEMSEENESAPRTKVE